MPAVTRYQCAICGWLFISESEMLACEALGVPEQPMWLAGRVGKTVAGFGETGISTGLLKGVVVRNYCGRHEIVLDVEPQIYLGHSQDYSEPWLPVCAVDPMRGVDFMRYAHHEPQIEIAEWVQWCEIYGIEADPEKAAWWRSMPERTRSMVLRVIEELRLQRSA